MLGNARISKEEFEQMNRILLSVAAVGLFGAALVSNARADEWDKKTILTVNEPIQVPNMVLPPGKYVMKLLDSPSNRHIVQIFNADESHLFTTILAIPNYRLQPTGKTIFTFWETPPGQPKSLHAWFYPGDNFGQEFAYPKQQAVSLAASNHATVPTTEAQSNYESAQVNTVNEAGTEAPMPEQTAQAAPPPPAPEPEPQAAPPAPAPQEEANRATESEAPQSLPKTGSQLPLIGLVGLLSLVGFVVVRVVRAS
jgi:LPXTG-motif cell wall-anchored protein